MRFLVATAGPRLACLKQVAIGPIPEWGRETGVYEVGMGTRATDLNGAVRDDLTNNVR